MFERTGLLERAAKLINGTLLTSAFRLLEDDRRARAGSSRTQQELVSRRGLSWLPLAARMRAEVAASSRRIGRWRRGISLRRASENVLAPLFAHARHDDADHVGQADDDLDDPVG